MKMKKESTLRTILNDVYAARSKEDALHIIISFLDTTPKGLNRKDIHIMRIRINQCSTLISMQTYMTNAFLKFEGLAVK